MQLLPTRRADCCAGGKMTTAWTGFERLVRFCLMMLAIVCLPAPGEAHAAAELDLTEQEAAWLAAHPVIRVGIDRDFAPYEWIDEDGKYVGLAADYMRILEARLGVRFEIIGDQPWSVVLDMAKRGELELLSCAVRTPEREQFLSFTEPYKSTRAVIIDQGRGDFIGSLEHLAGKRVAVEKGYFMQELLANNYPRIELTLAGSTKEALGLVFDGSADAYVGDAGTTNYAIKREGLLTLRFSGLTEYFSRHSVAIHRDYPELASIITKAMATISADEADAIFNRWLGLRIEQGVTTETLLGYAAGVVGFFLLIAYWVLRLRREIGVRKLAELHQQHHNRVLQMLAEKAPLMRVLNVIADNVAALNPDLSCRIGLVDDDGRSPWPPAFDPACDPGAGSCWSQPIRSGQGGLLGAFLIEHRHPRPPSAADLRLIEDEARLAALAIEKSADEARLQLAASVFNHAREGIMITDPDGTIVEINDTFTHITGYSRDEAIGQNPRLLKSGRHAPEFYAALWEQLKTSGHWAGEIWNRRKDGEVFADLRTISAVRDAAGTTQNFVALFTDITPMKEHQQQLEHIAHFDALTGLPNRVLLADRLQQAMIKSRRRDQSLAVAYLDLDGFKAVNDRHGHHVGDELLIILAQRMKAMLRDGDTLARIGGDEFVAVLFDLEQPQDWKPVIARLRQAAADPATVGDAVVQVTASIGVTLYPQDGADADQLIRHADQAMYGAKQEGKNRYHLFDVDHDAALQSWRDSLEHICRALVRREFVLYYQPKVNMKTGAVIGAEALIRWQHPERGLLGPAAFLPIIEKHPVGVELGEWVIDSALAQMSAWHAAGVDIAVSVNVAARQLQMADFVPRLEALLAAHPDVEPGCLELEVLETSAMDDMAHVSAVMHACHALGVRFALDDFGTGYSSLTYLKRLPADILKIDQSFVRDMLDDPDDLAIIEGVIGLATAFRREVIAEGVETVAHGELLLALGCELAQGYGIARPMPALELPGWIATWHPDAAWTAWGEHPPKRVEPALARASV